MDLLERLGVICPKCHGETRVIRTDPGEDHIRRDRLCQNPECRHYFATIEKVLGTPPEPEEHQHERDQGFPCPSCGAGSMVAQTRRLAFQKRRQRICLNPSCATTFHTKEVYDEHH